MDPDKVKLLFGPYTPPAVKVGDRTTCLYRDAEVVIFDWSMARIPWPLCHIAGPRPCGRGILVDDELARAIRHESAMAVQYWWGVCDKTVNKWRHAFGVGRTDAEGSRRLILQAAQGGLNARRNYAPARVKFWSAEELALLGTLPDTEVARRTGRSVGAIATRRKQMGIPPLERR